MKTYVILAMSLSLVSCATQKTGPDLTKSIDLSKDAESQVSKPVIEKDSAPIISTVACWDGSQQHSKERCPPPPIAMPKVCPDGRSIGWPFDCRTPEEIAFENGQAACKEQNLEFDFETSSCVSS